jgi:hypothetical protein
MFEAAGSANNKNPLPIFQQRAQSHHIVNNVTKHCYPHSHFDALWHVEVHDDTINEEQAALGFGWGMDLRGHLQWQVFLNVHTPHNGSSKWIKNQQCTKAQV